MRRGSRGGGRTPGAGTWTRSPSRPGWCSRTCTGAVRGRIACRSPWGRCPTPTGTVSSTRSPSGPGTSRRCSTRRCPSRSPTCGVALLPGPGELEPHCSCPDSGHPCKHAAALCYQTARLLDEDPFVLLLLRGRGERELLDALSRRNATRIARAAQDQEPAPLPGIRARDALARRALPPLPAPLPPPAHPEQPPTYPARRAARTRSRWTSWPPTRRLARTRCSPRAAIRSRG